MSSTRRWTIMAATGLALASAWAAQARADYVFGTPKNLGPKINSYEREYDPAVSADGLELYFQSYRSGGFGVCDLYVAKRATVADAWGSAQNLGPVVNTAAAESGPSLSADGLTLYFNSNRSGGQGGHDLYMTTRASRSDPWGPPVNLGPVVNSPYGEINPQISSDGLSLYFADVEGDTVVRPGGVGNGDIWVSTRASLTEPWAAPVNAGLSVNSPWIDGSPDISDDGLLLFLNFNRDGQVFFDIHVATRSTPNDPWCTPVSLGAPVNGANWDGNAELSADGRTLYFVSCCRTGGSGATDLWEASISPIVDFNGDGKIDDREVRMVMENWGKSMPLCDIGPTAFGDGIVDMKDLAVLTEYASQALVDPTLVGYWAFDETDGLAVCGSSAAYAATLVGDPVYRSDGAVGGAIELDGADDYVLAEFSRDPAKGPLSAFVWVKGGKPGQVILAQQGAANWLLTDGTGALMTGLKDGGRMGGPLVSQTVITDGQWHRVGVVWDGRHRTLYVDEEPVAEDVQNHLQHAFTGLVIGGGKDVAPGALWSGLIDDVRIYDRAVQP